MLKNFQPPYLGASYYPEDWEESEQEFDIAKMQELGINVVRISDFVWHNLEPEPGVFRFDWLHRIVDKLGKAGIAVVMCTPTAAPPRWLTVNHPEVAMELENGRKISHGYRRHCCSNQDTYRFYSARITEKLGQEFGKNPYVIGWQIDNEIYFRHPGCFCEKCVRLFHAFLQEKYGAIENLNDSWDLNTWSQAYADFTDIPAPRDWAQYNPHLKMEWMTFQQNSHIGFVHMQADILHAYTDAPISTDIMPFNGMDYRKLHEKLDIVQYNHYNTSENLYRTAMWFDYLRNIKERPFWNTETASCWSGSSATGGSLQPDGFCVVNSYMPLAMGGEMNLYWPWRTHWGSHEIMHGAVLDTSGRPMHIWEEIVQTRELMAKTGSFLQDTKVDVPAAFHFTSRNWNMLTVQPVVVGIETGHISHFYKPLNDLGIRADLIDAYDDLSGYKLLVSPFMMTLEEGDMQERIAAWVREGGTWVVGPATDIRDFNGARYKHKAYGMLEELTGARWKYGIPTADKTKNPKMVWTEDSSPFQGSLWYEVFEESPENTLAAITAGHSALVGKACVIHRAVGKGHVIIVGTIPEEQDLKRIYAIACTYAGLPHQNTEGELLVIPRSGNGRSGLILIQYSGTEGGAYTLEKEMRNVITGELVSGRIELKPFDIVVLEHILP